MINIEQVFRGVIKTLPNIYDGAFDRKYPLKTVNYFQKKTLNHRCLIMSWKHLWVFSYYKHRERQQKQTRNFSKSKTIYPMSNNTNSILTL